MKRACTILYYIRRDINILYFCMSVTVDIYIVVEGGGLRGGFGNDVSTWNYFRGNDDDECSTTTY